MSMKMPKETFTRLQEAISPLDTPERRARYRAGDFPRSDRTKDLNLRYRWDLLWVVFNVHGFHEELRSLSDNHIDTALRRIVPAL